jgi:hypothetical protein
VGKELESITFSFLISSPMLLFLKNTSLMAAVQKAEFTETFSLCV